MLEHRYSASPINAWFDTGSVQAVRAHLVGTVDTIAAVYTVGTDVEQRSGHPGGPSHSPHR
ncbi:MAG: hypothetical protein V9E94_02795 [Microthrixaceae bacterium]